MIRRAILPVIVVLGMTLPVASGPGAPGQTHDHGFSAGQPGDPNKPARVVQVAMREAGRKMLFSPDRVEVRKGEQIRFVIENEGIYDHEFVLATRAENTKHAKLMKKYPEMEHDDPNAKRVAPYTLGEIVWRFTKRGEFEFACLIPGHREAGMTGKVVVK
jgi:uncharacterized cupredoxin-like copper-binding protein